MNGSSSSDLQLDHWNIGPGPPVSDLKLPLITAEEPHDEHHRQTGKWAYCTLRIQDFGVETIVNEHIP
jgi:hypothetical protein